MTTMQALVWNRRTCRFDVKGEIQAQTRKNESTDAKHRGGCVRSSVELFVMNKERRDAIIQLNLLIQPEMGGNL
jgi:hypothetical protein